MPAPLAALGITSREVDVLHLVAEGRSNAEIAQRLFVSVRRVETHASRLLRKVGGSRADPSWWRSPAGSWSR